MGDIFSNVWSRAQLMNLVREIGGKEGLAVPAEAGSTLRFDLQSCSLEVKPDGIFILQVVIQFL